MGINEFYRTVLGQKLKNPMSWGAILPKGVVAINIWQEEIENSYAFIFSEETALKKDGNINPNWSERKTHVDMIKSGVPAVGILISNGGRVKPDGSWNIASFDECSTFELGELKPVGSRLYAKIDLNKPVPVSKVEFNRAVVIAKLENYPQAMAACGKAEKFGWIMVGMTEKHVTLKLHGKELMTVDISTGNYTRSKL